MGRHSASYIAAQQGLTTGLTAAGATKYVGRVGAFALAMGVGAAVAGGAGLANAEKPADNGTGGGAGAESSPGPNADNGGPADSSTDNSSTIKTRKPGPLSVPTTGLSISRALTGHLPGQTSAGPDPGSLPGLFSRIPQTAAPEVNGAIGASSPTHVRTAPKGSNPLNGLTPARPVTAPDDAVASFVGGMADDLAAALRSGDPTLGVVPARTADTTWQQRFTVSPSTTMTPESAAGFAAPAQAARVQAVPRFANPLATAVSNFLSALGFSPSASTGDSPTAPMPIMLGALQLIRREIERSFPNQASPLALVTSAQSSANPAIAPADPSPADETETAYGDIGKWMLKSNGQISDYGGQLYDGKTLLEPVNVIIVDPTSKTRAAATWKLNTAMLRAGFPAQPIHSTGFRGRIDDVTYGQLPKGLLRGFSDNFFTLQNDHGRIFGPDPVETSTGYVWSGAFSTEKVGLYNGLPTHVYVSSDDASTALATALVASGQATIVGMVPLDNEYNTATTTTGDHDGYAVVLQLK